MEEGSLKGLILYDYNYVIFWKESYSNDKKISVFQALRGGGKVEAVKHRAFFSDEIILLNGDYITLCICQK